MTPITPKPRAGYRPLVIAKDQPEYIPLPANHNGQEVETCWQLTWRERLSLLLCGKLHVSVLTFGMALQPIRIQTFREPDSCEGLATNHDIQATKLKLA